MAGSTRTGAAANAPAPPLAGVAHAVRPAADGRRRPGRSGHPAGRAATVARPPRTAGPTGPRAVAAGPRGRSRCHARPGPGTPPRTGARPWRPGPPPGRCAEHTGRLHRSHPTGPAGRTRLAGPGQRAHRARGHRPRAPTPAAGACTGTAPGAGPGRTRHAGDLCQPLCRRRKRLPGCAAGPQRRLRRPHRPGPAAAQARPARSGARRLFARRRDGAALRPRQDLDCRRLLPARAPPGRHHHAAPGCRTGRQGPRAPHAAGADPHRPVPARRGRGGGAGRGTAHALPALTQPVGQRPEGQRQPGRGAGLLRHGRLGAGAGAAELLPLLGRQPPVPGRPLRG